MKMNLNQKLAILLATLFVTFLFLMQFQGLLTESQHPSLKQSLFKWNSFSLKELLLFTEELLHPELYSDHKRITLVNPIAPCDLQYQNCFFEIEKVGKGLVELSPRPIYLNTPFQIEIHSLTFIPLKMEIDLQGLNMNMGYHRQTLLEPPWILKTLLPYCTEKVMDWKITLYIHTKSDVYGHQWIVKSRRK